MEEKRKKIKILAIQMSSVAGEKFANYEKVALLIRSKIKDGADFIVLPEVWTTGWNCERFRNSAENIANSQTINFLSEIAQNSNSNIIGGSFITERNGEYY